MAEGKIIVIVKFSWWFKWYVIGIWCMAKFCKWMGLPCVPDEKKIEFWAAKAVKVHVNGKRWKL